MFFDGDVNPYSDTTSLPQEETESRSRSSSLSAIRRGVIGNGGKDVSMFMNDDESGKERNWNKEFQELIESRYSHPESEVKRTVELRQLVEDFSKVAKRIGKLIIDELFLDECQKTLLPTTSTTGGIAGGEKYIYTHEGGIFFKIAVDKHNIYGVD
eukprot:TRINITY_DN27101_c0_g1_i1.p1 TRINITY_DN27101_c0_g1~~TRINITY_DN27101_c0_g1_i1.p1  ORF type:complete len:156 (-),score=34.00 TRINITY_DN27101_c0_g1_i1:254-721(-)